MNFQETTLIRVKKELEELLERVRPHAGENPLDTTKGIFNEIFSRVSYSIVNIDISLWKNDNFLK